MLAYIITLKRICAQIAVINQRRPLKRFADEREQLLMKEMMMQEKSNRKKYVFEIAHLVISGVVIGFYVAKGTGFLGVDVTAGLEHLGMVVGGVAGVILKAVHLA